MQVAAEERKAARAEAEAARREEQRAAKQAEADAYQDADWIRAGEEEQLAKMDAPVEDEGPSQVRASCAWWHGSLTTDSTSGTQAADAVAPCDGSA